MNINQPEDLNNRIDRLVNYLQERAKNISEQIVNKTVGEEIRDAIKNLSTRGVASTSPESMVQSDLAEVMKK
jgi:hypothetical protein